MKINWISVIVLVGAVLYAIYGAEELWRRYVMRRLAKKFGFTCLRERLPEALSLYGTPFAHCRFTRNVLVGLRGKPQVVVFDCQVCEGEAGWCRSVIAVRTGTAVFDAAKLNAAMKVDSSGGWSVVYYPAGMPRSLTPIRELRAHLKSI